MLLLGMPVYLLFGPAIFFILIVLCSGKAGSGTILAQLLRGILVWVIGYLVFLFVGPLVPIRFSAGGIYLFFLFHDFGYWSLVALIGYALFGFRSHNEPVFDRVANCGAYILGVFLLAPVVDLIQRYRLLNPYYLFLLPSLRIVLIAGFSILVSRFRRIGTLSHLLSLLAFAVVSLLAAVVPLLYTVGRPGYAYLVCALLVSGSVALLGVTAHAEE